jgi:uncharacterized protein
MTIDLNNLPSPLLAALVTGIAFLYASIGFGGATGYLAVMSLYGIAPNIMASSALGLNVIVAGISFSSYARAGHFRRDLSLPFLLTSVPAAFIGGYFKVQDDIYFLLLYALLTYGTFNMLVARHQAEETDNLHAFPRWQAMVSGAVIGLLSGVVGIGGGIFLSPLIILAGWGTPKQAAATSAAFIVLNSLSGLAGRLTGGNLVFGWFGAALIPLGVLGGLAGSYLGARYFPGVWLRRILGIVLLIAVGNYWLGRLK